jgi:RHS repeat-associated protein
VPFGEVFIEERNNKWNTPYLFNAKELDEETGLYYYGARYYDPRIGLFLGVDPLSEKYPNFSVFAYCLNNSINVIDPDGREGIVITGGEYDAPNRYKYNFVEPAITRLKELKSAGGSEPITWAVMTAGYSEKDIAKFQSIASDLDVGFQAIGSADELTNYLNSKSVGSYELSEARTGDQVTSMTVFGHGFAGSAEFAYNQGAETQQAFSWGMNNASQLNAGAFSNATINFYTCNAGTGDQFGIFGNSLVGSVANATNATVSGYWGKTDYATINTGQGFGAKLNRAWNGFNTNGSLFMPSAGTKTVDGVSYPSTLFTISPPVRK